MKKLFVILLSFIYLVLSTGFTQYVHVCKSTATMLTSMYQDNKPDTPCPICAAKQKDLKEKKKGCCKHESKLVQVDTATKNKFSNDLGLKLWGDAIPNRTLGAVFDVAIANASLKTFTSSNAFPPIQSTPLYIIHCIYRI